MMAFWRRQHARHWPVEGSAYLGNDLLIRHGHKGAAVVEVRLNDGDRGVSVLIMELIEVEECPAHASVKVRARIGGFG